MGCADVTIMEWSVAAQMCIKFELSFGHGDVELSLAY